jgi:alkylated DNA repair protein (DNA oxidative demethylase)
MSRDQLTLFARPETPAGGEHQRSLPAGVAVLAGFALSDEARLVTDLERVTTEAPFRIMVTPGGQRMSAAMTNCGELGWITDRSGYRYVRVDPGRDRVWPAMPPSVRDLAVRAAAAAGFPCFEPDACLVNRYVPGARMSLHQDRDERDFSAPIVSVSLGLPAVFLFGGPTRRDKPERVPLSHGDVVVWGGPARLHFHGVSPIADGHHPALGACRLNLTIRKAG